MTVGDFETLVTGALLELREAAESLMVDTCTITRPDGGTTTDEWGREVPAEGTVAYEGRCKVQTYQPYEQNPDVGGQAVVSQRYTLHIPVSAGVIRPGFVATITAAVHNPALVGSKFRVAGPHEKSLQTAQRLLVDHMPEEAS